jgi:peptidoglycan/LPS O-acetylase OafA/YrhL
MSIGLRDRKIDLIRGVAILLVLFHHFDIAYPLGDTTLARAFGWQAVNAVARNGNYGVTMFFVVSGYLIASNAERRWNRPDRIDARTFYALRAARILPCLLLLIGTADLLAISGPAIFRNHGQDGAVPSLWLADSAALTCWMNVLIGREGWFNYILGVLWSLSVEEVFYLSFPILCRFLRREVRLVGFWAAIIVAGPFYRLAHQGDEAGYLYAYFASFDGIAIGCCTAVLAKRVGRLLPPFVVVAGMACLYLWRPIQDTNVLGVTLMAVGTAMLLLGGHVQPTGPVRKRMRAPGALDWFGRLSYELYMFHLVVLGAVRAAFLPRDMTGDGKLLLLALFLALSAGLSATIARWYADPLNRAVRGFLAVSARDTTA